ncbi:MAG: Homoserine kinase [Euryarchaeota archaeon UBA443]|nr:MAG: Homoserine kinase [Euryarchaeota archaeon UBA443]
MAVLGRGNAHGACSLLHAAGTGYGASMALDLPILVRVLDKKSKRDVHDEDGLLPHVVEAWKNAGYELPIDEENLHWAVQSKIPPREGLKSSSGLCVAAVRALCDSTNTSLELHQIVAIAVDAQLRAEITLTGSIDDTWACATGGWKLINANEDVAQGVLLEGDGPVREEWKVLIVSRGPRETRPSLEDFLPHQQQFIQALNAIQEGNELVALTLNGRGVIGATKDHRARILTNDALVNGARAAGPSGSGTAIVIVIPIRLEGVINRIKSWYSSKYPDFNIIETRFINPERKDSEE